MAQLQSRTATGERTWPIESVAGSVVCARFEYDLAAALALNDIIEIGILPAFATVVDATLITDDLDTNGTPLISLDVGIMSGAFGEVNPARTCGNELFAASTAGRTGVVERMSKPDGFKIADAGDHRSIGVKVAAAPATGATTGKITLLVYYVQ